MQDTPSRDYTKLSPEGEQKLRLNKELSQALPTATEEEIDQVQAPLQTAPEEVVAATVEDLRAAPDEETLERVRAGEAASLLVEPETTDNPRQERPMAAGRGADQPRDGGSA
jgi:hypothetical protein